MKILVTLLSALTLSLTFISCGNKDAKENIQAPAGMVALDLSRYGKQFSIFVPDTTAAKLEVTEQSWGALEIKIGKNFRMSITEDPGDIELRKSDIKSNDVNIFKKLQLYQNGGKEKKKLDQLSVADNYFTLTGNNKMTCFQAALGLSQLVQIEELLLKRQQIRQHYHQKLKEISQVDFLEDNSEFSSPHLMTIQIDFSSTKTNKEKIMRYLLDNGIETKICYSPLYQQDSLKYSLDCDKEYPSMDLYYERALTLPFYTGMTERQVNYICQLLKNALN